MKGEAKGRARILGALRAYLAIAYPALAHDPAIERIATLEQASDALERVYRAKSEQEARSILTSA